MPKEILNLKEKPLSINTLLTIEKKLIDSPFEFIDIINFSVNDLVFLRRAIAIANEKEEGFDGVEEERPEAPQQGETTTGSGEGGNSV